ncbi:type VII secretion protein EccB [Kitasatospora sp. MAP12-15]|uniref:type VII secretion protein EccB n=1 Tax=unclassified Kitasatospora TaxID=2633591 RepID=UPI002473F71F|nr:type VII secretion protein EccB [Kitasatospora sp. MAP12-44]MDH6108938.1 type VII secretion protein EccB [Kitasatospora sp. MAP12-44]
MQSRRDQVQAHLFVMSRLASGMLRAEPDAPDTPTSRTTRGALTGLALAVLIGLGTTVYGVMKPGGNTGWAKSGTLVVVNETGARFLYAGGLLHPVLNETSAKLLAGDQLTVDQVGQASLSGAPRGGPVGILGAPDGLPPAAGLGAGAWLACGTLQPTAAGGLAPSLSLLVGPRQEGGALAPGQGLLVGAPDGSVQLLWHGQRLRADTKDGALDALGYGGTTPFAVTAGFLDSLPAGPDLASPDIPGRGAPGPVLAGRPSRVGQLFQAPGGAHYVLTQAGLVPLTDTQFALLRGDLRTQRDAYAGAATGPAAIGPDDLAAHTAPGNGFASTLPSAPPALLAPGPAQAVCADLHVGSGAPAASVTVLDAATASAAQPPAAQPGVSVSCTTADRIAVHPGGGALVRALSGAGTGSTDYLVTDAGVKYPLASAAVVKQLGYAAVSPAAVPDGLLALLPTGPSLDPAPLASGGVVVTAVAGTAPCG